MRVLLTALSILLTTAAAAADIPTIRAGRSTTFWAGPFVADDGTTAATPTGLTWRHLRAAFSSQEPPVVVAGPTAIATPSCTTCRPVNGHAVAGCCIKVQMPVSQVAVVRADTDRERHSIDYVWTWAGTCGGEACTGHDVFEFDVQR